MNEEKYPYSDREFRLKNRVNIIVNDNIYTFLAINAAIFYFLFDEDNKVLILALIFICLIPISIIDPLKGNNSFISNLLNGFLYIIACAYYFHNTGEKMMVIVVFAEICVLLMEVLLLKRKVKSSIVRYIGKMREKHYKA